MAQDTGKILEWLKAEGDAVTEGEAIAIIETDKASVDLEAPASGVLARISAAAGEEVPVGQVIALIRSAGEADVHSQPPSLVREGGAEERLAASLYVSSPEAHLSLQPPSLAREEGGESSRVAWSGGSRERVAASPKARRLAAESGIDLASLRGTGPGGAVVVADLPVPVAAVHATPQGNGAVVTAAAVAADTADTAAGALSTIWRLMAERTTTAWATTPHFFLVREVHAGELLRWHERLRGVGGPEISVTDLLVKIAAEALERHPRMRASWQQGAIVQSDEINVGIAVATEESLVVPVIHQANDLSIEGIAKRRRDLVERARAWRLRPRDLQDGTFTISNLGMYGIDAFNAILNAGQAGILAVGRIADRVVPVNGQPAVQPMCTLTLSCDHRVVDGARGAQFLATLAVLLERPRE
jgi:pyruvate dehydrogenase E2 component (dihydrolipoamide acetyltransferase)